MKQVIEAFFRILLWAIILLVWWFTLKVPLSNGMNLSIIAGGVLLTFPVVWIGRLILDHHRIIYQTNWITTFVHFSLGFTLGLPLIKAISTHQDWPGLIFAIPTLVGLILVIITGIVLFLTVFNLAIKGFGAPFFIKLSSKLVSDWMYAWTRNPMVLATLSFLLSLGIWFQSLFFVLWVIFLFTPALLFFIKVYEERELEFRFGASYLEYKSKTPVLFPKKPGKYKRELNQK
jgi:protein-S-isoprenylcysteine O-methyltransferase Ste14